MQKIFSSITAATGKQLKQSVKVFHSLMLYRLLPEVQSSVHRRRFEKVSDGNSLICSA
jgi:hypothetical protein